MNNIIKCNKKIVGDTMTKLKTLIAALFVTFVGSNMAMNENEIKIQKQWTLEEIEKLDESVIREVLDGPVDAAAQLIKDISQIFTVTYPEIEFTHHDSNRHDKNRLHNCRSCAQDIFFSYVTTQDVIKIIKAHKECAEIFLTYCHEQIFVQLRSTEFAKNFIDAVKADNLADVSYNLYFLVNHKLDKDLAQKFASYINADNITKLNSWFLTYILKSDSSVVEMIAQNAITQDNIKELSNGLKSNILWDGSSGKRSSMLDMLLETNIKVEDIIIKNAITGQNAEKHLSKIKKSVKRSKELSKQRELRIRDEVAELLLAAKNSSKEQWKDVNEEAIYKIVSGPKDLAVKFYAIADQKGCVHEITSKVQNEEISKIWSELIKEIEPSMQQNSFIISKL